MPRVRELKLPWLIVRHYNHGRPRMVSSHMEVAGFMEDGTAYGYLGRCDVWV